MEANKVIKYFGIGLAIVIIINICVFVLSIIMGVSSIFDYNNTNYSKPKTKYTQKFEVTERNDKVFTIDNIDIELGASKLKIINDENELRVDTNNDYVEVREKDNKLIIKEKSSWFRRNKNVETIIYVPNGLSFNEIDIEMGAGTLTADRINATKLEMNMGAGSTEIDEITGSIVDIETGAGRFNLKNSIINNLDLDMGVGEVNIGGDINNADIDAGVGSLNLTLTNNKEYKYIINKGLGSIKINNESVSNGTYGSGINTIKIDGGVGSINVNTK